MTLNEAAKQFLMAYLGDGKIRQPEHFDREILGVDLYPAVIEILMGQQPAWNKTVFADALGELIEEGKIKAWDDESGWHYQFDSTIKVEAKIHHNSLTVTPPPTTNG